MALTKPGDPYCWRKIGVWGLEQPRCEKLENHIHCRNCPVFLEAGQRQYNREIATDYLQSKTESLSQPIQTGESGRTEAVMLFKVGGETLALPIQIFQEVRSYVRSHPVPHTRNPAFLGLVSHQGRLRLSFSLAHLLGCSSAANSGFLLALELCQQIMIFPVDEILGLHRFSPEQLEPAHPGMGESLFANSRGSLQQGQITLLDQRKLSRTLEGLFER